MRTDKWKKRLIVFIICFSIVVPGMFSEIITTNSITSQDIDTQLGTLGVDDPIGGTTFTTNGPALIAPTNGLITFDRTVTFSWESVPLVMAYQLQVDNNADFSSPVIDVNTGTTASHTSGTLSNGLYYWRVRHQILFIWSTWSAQWNVRVNYLAPPLVNPPSGRITFDSTPYLDWGSVSGASTYILQIDDSSSFTSVNYQYSTSGTYFYPSLPNRVWYWRVCARDSQGYYGPYSGYRSLRVDTTPPALVSPANGLLTNDATPYLDWNGLSGANLYALQVSTNSAFTSIVYSTSTTATGITTPTLSNGIKYWRVRARDYQNFWGPYSSYRYFTIDTVVPDAPTLITPQTGVFMSDDTPFLDWSTVSTAVQYRLQIALSGAFTDIQLEVYTSATSYTTPQLPDGYKFWRVCARDTAGNWGSWSTTRYFIIDTVAPSQPSLVSPDDGLLDNDPTIFLNWSSATGGYQYRVQVSANIAFSSIVAEAIIGDTYYTTSVLSDFEYYWRVCARDEAENWGSWSEIRSFIIDTTTPTISAVSNDPSTPTDTEPVTISCDVYDLNDVDEVTLYYRINGGSWIGTIMPFVSGTTFAKNIGIFEYGTFIEYYVTASDSSAHPNVATDNNGGLYYSFTIAASDVTGPSIEDIQHEPLIPTDLQTVNVTCTVTDPNGIYNVTLFYRVDSGSWEYVSMTLLSGDTYCATIGAFNYGEVIEYYVIAFDDYVLHNAATDDNTGLYYTFTILSGDVIFPVITAISHSPLSPTEVDSVTISCDVTDASGIQYVILYYRIDGGSWLSSYMTLSTGDTYILDMGTFDYEEVIEYYIRAIDNSPNHNIATDNNGGLYYSVTILSSDTTSPTINTVLYTPTSPTQYDDINVTCYASDASGILSVELHYRLNGGGWSSIAMTLLSDNIYSVVLDPFAVGDLVEFYITATDDSAAQNVATDDNGGLDYSITITNYSVPTPIAYLIPMITMFSVIVIIRKRK